MITVILETKSGETLIELPARSNAEYLCQNDSHFPLLSRLGEFSYDSFGGGDMPALICELQELHDSLNDQIAKDHVGEIIGLADRCAKDEELMLTFTPFKE